MKALAFSSAVVEAVTSEKIYDKYNADGTIEYEITCKCDGGRVLAFKRNGEVTLISRQGKVWEGLHEIEDAIKNLSEDNIVLDGELTIYDLVMKFIKQL